MKVLKAQIWDRLPFPDYRARFFIEVWMECLHRKTPYFFQARLMTPGNHLAELVELLDDSLSDERNLPRLCASAEELLQLLKDDESFRNIAPSSTAYIIEILATYTKNQKNITKRPGLGRLRQATLHLLSFKQAYIEVVARELQDALRGVAPSRPRKRELDHIYTLTRRFISILLAEGYSSTYLYNRVRRLAGTAYYSAASYHERLSQLLDRLLKPTATYKVIKALWSSDNEFFEHEKIAGIDFTTDLSKFVPDEDYQNRLKKNLQDVTPNESTGFLVSTVEATDYISAVWGGQTRIEKALDWIAYQYRAQNVLVLSPDAVVLHTENNATHRHWVQQRALEERLHHRSADKSDALAALSNLADQHLCSESALVLLQRVLRYYRMGIFEPTFESKFLSMWIALETLVQGDEHTVLSRLCAFVPGLYAYNSLEQRLRYLLYLLSAYTVRVPRLVQKNLNLDLESFRGIISLPLMYRIISNDKLANAVYDELSGLEFLKYRLAIIAEEFKSKESIIKRINKTQDDVSKQLGRIYFMRNKIVHRAFHGEIRPVLYGHLSDYLECVINYVIFSFTEHDRLTEIDEVIEGLSMAIDMKETTWVRQTALSSEDILHLMPVI